MKTYLNPVVLIFQCKYARITLKNLMTLEFNENYHIQNNPTENKYRMIQKSLCNSKKKYWKCVSHTSHVRHLGHMCTGTFS
jgi:hypothetical protein